MAIHDVFEYIHWTLPHPVFYIEDILPQTGTMLVYGDPKVKKSWLVEHIGYSIATGTNWIGFRTVPARVLMCQFEVSPYSYQYRLKLMSRHFANIGQPNTYFEMTRPITYLEHDELYNSFNAEIRESNCQPQVIILDCMSACFGGDENSGEQMAAFIERISTLKQNYNASLILVHHANKNILNPSSVSKARGHSRLTGWVDTLLYMAEIGNGVQLQIKARQSIHDIPNINIQFRDYQWTRQGGFNAGEINNGQQQVGN